MDISLTEFVSVASSEPTPPRTSSASVGTTFREPDGLDDPVAYSGGFAHGVLRVLPRVG